MARTEVTQLQQAKAQLFNLNRLVGRLEQRLSNDGEKSLRESSLARSRVGANLDYAQSLLLCVEHDSQNGAFGHAKRSEFLSTLQQSRETITRLKDRLSELERRDDSERDEGEEDDEEDEAMQIPDAETANDASLPTNVGRPDGSPTQGIADGPTPPSSTLRARRPASATNKALAATTTGTSTSLGRKTEDTSADPSLAKTETLLSHHRDEQENLTNSLLSMAQALKNQSIQFGSSLETEKGMLGRATEGLDKNQAGLEAAGARMSTLRRMTEGQGWWGRMKLYALIALLWIAAFLLVFVGPKLRF